MEIPLSGRYVNGLPGISLKAVDNMANSEQVTYAKVWENVQERAIADFGNKVTAKFAERFRLKQVLQNIDLGEEVDSTNMLPSALEYRGFTYQVKCETDQYFKPSALQHVYVQQVKVYAINAGNITVKIFDLEKKKQLYTKSITAVQGWNTIVVHESFKAFRMFFAIDASATDTAYQELNEYALGCCAACTYSLYGDSGHGWLQGAKASTADPYTLSEGSNIFGVSADISLHCSFDNVVCKNLPVFENALWYKHGEELMIERLASPRFNLTTIDTKEAQELQKYFMDKADDYLNIAVAGIDLDLNDSCIDCNAMITYGTSRM